MDNVSWMFEINICTDEDIECYHERYWTSSVMINTIITGIKLQYSMTKFPVKATDIKRKPIFIDYQPLSRES